MDDGHQFEGFGLVYWGPTPAGAGDRGLALGAESAIEDGLNGYLVPPTAERRRGARLRWDDPALGDRLGGRAGPGAWKNAAPGR